MLYIANWVELLNRTISKYCGDSRLAHSDLMEQRIAIEWEALSQHGNDLRIAENYIASYSGVMNPAAGENTPRLLAYLAIGVGATPVWQGIRMLENIAGHELQSPASIGALAAGYQGANDALLNYYRGEGYYECGYQR